MSELVVMPAADLVKLIEGAVARALAARPQELPATGQVDRRGLARALGCSLVTVDRAVRDGLPSSAVGARRRFDVEACRAWFAARGQRPVPKPAPADDVDVSAALARGGLRPRTP